MGYGVKDVTSEILKKLEEERNISSGKAYLSKLRNSIGKPLSQSIEVWPFVFRYLPSKFLSDTTSESYQEKAILTTLQFYSLHQQGVDENVNLVKKENSEEEKEKTYNLGSALRSLRNGDDEVSVDRRFNTMITSTTFEEFVYHLRHLIKLLKSKSRETKVNYPGLSEDLYWFLIGYDENIRLKWAREYYRGNFKGEKENEQ